MKSQLSKVAIAPAGLSGFSTKTVLHNPMTQGLRQVLSTLKNLHRCCEGKCQERIEAGLVRCAGQGLGVDSLQDIFQRTLHLHHTRGSYVTVRIASNNREVGGIVGKLATINRV